MQGDEVAAAFAGFAHYAFIDEAEALVKVTGAGVVFVDVEVEAVGAEVVEDGAHKLVEDATAESLAGRGDDEALELDGAGGFLDAAEKGEGADAAAGVGVADEVAGVGAGECCEVAFFRP